MSEQRDKLVRGSIRVFKDKIFYEDKEIQQINIKYDDLDAVLHVTSIPNDLREIFDKAEISWVQDKHKGLRLKSVIKGLDFDDIEMADEEHLRVRFSGLTDDELADKLQKAEKWFDKNNIEHGEKDGKAACIFKCLTSEQLMLRQF